MYAFIHQPVSCLEGGSLVVLRAMRIWVVAANQRLCPLRAIIPEFGCVLSTADDVRDMHRLMLMLHRNGLRPMRFAMPDALQITEAEALMLMLWADSCAGRAKSLRATLGLIVGEAAVLPMQQLLDRLSACLAIVGLAPVGRRHHDTGAA